MYAEPKHFRSDEVPNMRDILDPLASRCVALESENMAFLVRTTELNLCRLPH